MLAKRKELWAAMGKFWAQALSNATKRALLAYEFGLMLRLSHSYVLSPTNLVNLGTCLTMGVYYSNNFGHFMRMA